MEQPKSNLSLACDLLPPFKICAREGLQNLKSSSWSSYLIIWQNLKSKSYKFSSVPRIGFKICGPLPRITNAN